MNGPPSGKVVGRLVGGLLARVVAGVFELVLGGGRPELKKIAAADPRTLVSKLLQAPPQVINGCTGGRMLAHLNPKCEASLSPNAIILLNRLFCIRFLTVRSACAQPAHNLSPEPFSQTSSQASFQGQGGRGVHGRKSLVLLNLKSEAPLSPNAILVQNRVFCIRFFKVRGACAQPAQNLSPKPFNQTSEPG